LERVHRYGNPVGEAYPTSRQNRRLKYVADRSIRDV
jgi:hypothetical protein